MIVLNLANALSIDYITNLSGDGEARSMSVSDSDTWDSIDDSVRTI